MGFVLINSNQDRIRLKDETLTPYFEYLIQAYRYIQKNCNGSEYIQVMKIKR